MQLPRHPQGRWRESEPETDEALKPLPPQLNPSSPLLSSLPPPAPHPTCTQHGSRQAEKGGELESIRERESEGGGRDREGQAAAIREYWCHFQHRRVKGLSLAAARSARLCSDPPDKRGGWTGGTAPEEERTADP
ncbi:hypothetical protein FQA47_005639 [Oryzias melastigma]|uniref:Uncharacterized protein n=1 Tax=Oryzias melastigma TaxID=30732 RepID=A0A834F3Y9_ORYME|nr:hypothetical protein FQA47_005639 [Oryzias melastigma]